MYDDSIKESIDHVETFMNAFSLEESDLGMILSPTYEDEKMGLDYFVKGTESEIEPTLDATVYTQFSAIEFKNKVYEEWIEAFQQEFPEAEIISTDPSQFEEEPQSAD